MSTIVVMAVAFSVQAADSTGYTLIEECKLKSDSSDFPISPWAGAWQISGALTSDDPSEIYIFEEGNIQFSYKDKPDEIGLYIFTSSDYLIDDPMSEKFCITSRKIIGTRDVPNYVQVCTQISTGDESKHVHIYGSVTEAVTSEEHALARTYIRSALR